MSSCLRPSCNGCNPSRISPAGFAVQESRLWRARLTRTRSTFWPCQTSCVCGRQVCVSGFRPMSSPHRPFLLLSFLFSAPTHLPKSKLFLHVATSPSWGTEVRQATPPYLPTALSILSLERGGACLSRLGLAAPLLQPLRLVRVDCAHRSGTGS